MIPMHEEPAASQNMIQFQLGMSLSQRTERFGTEGAVRGCTGTGTGALALRLCSAEARGTPVRLYPSIASTADSGCARDGGSPPVVDQRQSRDPCAESWLRLAVLRAS